MTMPSPFPGMDPFLEHPFYFPNLHSGFVYCMSESLQGNLPEPYFAVLNERLWVEAAGRLIEPDVDVLARGKKKPKPSNGAVAVAEARTRPIVIPILHDERRETYLDIRTRTGDKERVVTTIEVLSLTNKTRGQRGRKLY